MIETSETMGEFAGALSKAQGEIDAAEKTRQNPHFKNFYATLASVREACREPFAKNGLATVQGATSDGATVTVTTLLVHSSGEWARSALSATARDATPQSIGSAITYLRRYGLMGMAGIAPEDDDANGAQVQHAPTPYRPPAAHPIVEKAKETFPGSVVVEPSQFERIVSLVRGVFREEEGADRDSRLLWYFNAVRKTSHASLDQCAKIDQFSPSKAFAALSVERKDEVEAAAKALAAKQSPPERIPGEDDEP